jgi:hypothetical protein
MRKSKKRNLRIIATLLLTVFFSVGNVEQCCAQNLTKIDWLQGYVTVSGRGFAKKTGGPMDIDNAVDAAKIEAQSELLEIIEGVRIDSQTVVRDMMVERMETSARVRGFLRNAIQIGEPEIKEEGSFVAAVVQMRVCLHNNGAGCKAMQPLTSVLPKSPGNKSSKDASCDLLPNLTSTQEILSKISYDTSKPLQIIVINLEGKPFNTDSRDFAMGFESGKGQKCSIYTPEKVDPVIRRDRGTAEMFLRVSDAEKKYGTNVLTISAKSISPENYVVIDKKDAYLINLINDQAKHELFLNAKIAIAVH